MMKPERLVTSLIGLYQCIYILDNAELTKSNFWPAVRIEPPTARSKLSPTCLPIALLSYIILDFDYEDKHNDLLVSILTSHYYTEKGFIKKCTPGTCTIMIMNCQSLHSKFDDIKLLLNSFELYEKPIQVLCLQELGLGMQIFSIWLSSKYRTIV